MKLLHKLEKQKSTWFLLLTVFLFFLLRLPSIFEPYWYGDEGIYQVIGTALKQGRILYTGIWDNKPPLLYVLYAFFNGDQTSVRIFSLCVGLCTVIAFYFLSKKLFLQEKIQFITTGIFAFLFATPFLEGNIANAENFMLLPILLAAIVVYMVAQQKPVTKPSFAHLILLLIAGIALGIAFLTKIVAFFDFTAFFIYLFFISYTKLSEIQKQMKILGIFVAGFFVPFLLTSIIFFFQGNLHAFFISAFFSNVNYVAYGNTFVIPRGLLMVKLGILCLLTLLLFYFRKKFTHTQLFIFLWIVFSLFDIFFSQRPYTHYVLMILSSLSLGFGLWFSQKRTSRPFTLGMLSLLILIDIPFGLHTRIPKYLFGYYGNFIGYTMQQKSTAQYDTFFDKVTIRNATLAQYINNTKKPNDRVFIWGDIPQIYMITNTLPLGRFIVAYHMDSSASNMKETAMILAQIKPKYIIIFPNEPALPYSLNQYTPRLTIDRTTIYEKIL